MRKLLFLFFIYAAPANANIVPNFTTGTMSSTTNTQTTITESITSKDYNKTLILCHSTVGKAILNTSITIVFGFSILVLSKFIPTIYFGIFTGLAMLLAMVSVLTLLPSLILLIKPFNK